MFPVPSLAGQVLFTCFFLWNLLDGVDGNLARYKGISSPMGSVVDAMSGYSLSATWPWGWRLLSFSVRLLKPEWLLVLGLCQVPSSSSRAWSCIRPLTRCRPGQKPSTQRPQELCLAEVIALNLTSISGMLYADCYSLWGGMILFKVGYFEWFSDDCLCARSCAKRSP